MGKFIIDFLFKYSKNEDKNLIIIKFIGIKNIILAEDMFFGCRTLKSISNIENWNTNYLINISGLFCECSTL